MLDKSLFKFLLPEELPEGALMLCSFHDAPVCMKSMESSPNGSCLRKRFDALPIHVRVIWPTYPLWLP